MHYIAPSSNCNGVSGVPPSPAPAVKAKIHFLSNNDRELCEEAVLSLSWPTNSADLNLIKHSSSIHGDLTVNLTWF